MVVIHLWGNTSFKKFHHPAKEQLPFLSSLSLFIKAYEEGVTYKPDVTLFVRVAFTAKGFSMVYFHSLVQNSNNIVVNCPGISRTVLEFGHLFLLCSGLPDLVAMSQNTARLHK